MGSRIADIVGTLLTIALVTTLILPQRQTGAVITATGNSLATNIRAAMGLGK